MANTLTASVAEEIRAELGRQRRSGVWLARQVGMTQSRFSRRLVGDLPFDLNELEQVAAALNVPLGKLLGWATDHQNGPTTRQYLADSVSDLIAA
jgi:hypothetical protein